MLAKGTHDGNLPVRDREGEAVPTLVARRPTVAGQSDEVLVVDVVLVLEVPESLLDDVLLDESVDDAAGVVALELDRASVL